MLIIILILFYSKEAQLFNAVLPANKTTKTNKVEMKKYL